MTAIKCDIIGSYATLAERPVWALATKDFDTAYQFNQKWLEELPKLVELAAAEGSIVYMDTASRISDLSYDAAQRARLAAAANGHVNALEWLEERRPTRYIHSDVCKKYKDYMEEVRNCNYTDAVRIWTIGAAYADVREWAGNLARKHFMILASLPETPAGVDAAQQIFMRSAVRIAAQNGDIAALDQIRVHTVGRFNIWAAMLPALSRGCMPVIKWCLPGLYEPEECPGNALLIAAKYKNFEVLQLLAKKGFSLPPNNRYDATSNIKILQYLVEAGYQLNTLIYSNTAGDGEVETLKWLQEQKCPLDLKDALIVAVIKNNYPVVEYLLDIGAPSRGVLTEASLRGGLRMIRLCVARGVKWDGAEMTGAARNNRLEVLKLLKELGAPMHPNACNAALENNNYEAYLWLRKAGCPQDEQTKSWLRQLPTFVKKESSLY